MGDGGSADGPRVGHVYAVGTFTATVTVTDDQGATATAETEVSVAAAPTPADRGDLSGVVTLSNALAEGELVGPEGASPQWPAGSFVPGEVIVRFAPESVFSTSGSTTSGSTTLGSATLSVAGRDLERVRALPVDDTYLYRLTDAAARTSSARPGGLQAAPLQVMPLQTAPLQAATLQVVGALGERADVVTATPNRIYYALKTPDDEFYVRQWHYPAINLPQAWDLTTGSAATVVAVVDTGILGEVADPAATHPDFVGRLLPGYDFISDADTAGDGDGRDADPYDLGTFQSNGTHGSHVAGIIAANGDDGVGVAGVDWAAKILPVRVLGTKGSGTLSDILDGVAWAAGLRVQGVPANPNPADVINLSLGSDGPCDPAEAALFDRVIGRGTVVVVAAGNGNENANLTSPASCAAVLTIGAVDFTGQRAPYSNFGSVDLMAPGGDIGADANGDHYPDGVLSTIYDAVSGGFYWDFLQGTSMASPHVVGVVALMKAVDPNLTPAQIEAVLKATARPRTTQTCNGQNRSSLSAADCGAGLVDAFAAVQAARRGSVPPPPPPDSRLTFNPSRLDFGTNKTKLSLVLGNPGTASLEWRFDTFFGDPSNPAQVGDAVVKLSDLSGTLPAGGSKTVTVTLERGEAPASGNYHLDLGFETGDAGQLLPLFFSKGEAVVPPSGTLDGTLMVACFVKGDGCDPDESRAAVVKNRANSAPYTFSDLGAGRYQLIGWKDINDNEKVDGGDYFGFYSRDGLGSTEVEPPASGLDFPVSTVVGPDGTSALPQALADFLTEAKRKTAAR